jgi:succinate dehydrogenase / fumarate reductase cytochrome b subunit
MPPLGAILRSSVGKKLVSGFTGLLLSGFVLAHLIGNLLLLVGRDAFNEYAYFLEHMGHGFVIYVMEAGLIAVFLFHAVSGVQVALDRRRARSTRYEKTASAGGASRQTLASRSMIVTGIVLFLFVPLHVAMFKFGVGTESIRMTAVDGVPFRDLYQLVVDWFKSTPTVAAYVAVMLLLGTHLRHGFWSAFQSLGAANPRYMPLIYGTGLAFAAAIAFGFLFIPVYVYLFVDPTAVGAMVAG